MVDRRDQGARRHQPRHGRLRVLDLARAQAAGADAAPLWPEPGRPLRLAAADRRSREAAAQGELLPCERDRLPLHCGPRGRGLHGAGRLQRHSVRRRLARGRLRHHRLDRQRLHRPPTDLRARRHRHLRLPRRRLGERVEVLAPRLDAHGRAARLL